MHYGKQEAVSRESAAVLDDIQCGVEDARVGGGGLH